jgi:hypothetical protein
MSSSAVTKIASGGGTEVVRLSHFNIGGHHLRPEHINYLDSSVVPILDQGGSILLIGMASRSGSAASNKMLSQLRNDEVLKRLRSKSKADFKVRQDFAAGESAAAQAHVADGTEDPTWRAVQIVFWKESEPPPPPPPPTEEPPKDTIDMKKAAEVLGLEEHEFNRLYNQYNWTIDTVVNLVGMAGEFAPIAVAAAEAISVGTLFIGMITQFVGFFAYLARLDQEDGIRFGTFGASYMMGDWVVGTKLLTDGTVFQPTFPDLWVKKNFAFAGASRFPGFQTAWNTGAERMGKNMSDLLQQQYTKYLAEAAKKGTKPAGAREIEQLSKLLFLKSLNFARFGKEAQGFGVTNHVYGKLRPEMEKKSSIKIYLKTLPYPSENMNYL